MMANRTNRSIAYVKYLFRLWRTRYLFSPINLASDAGTLKNIASENARRTRWSAWVIVVGLAAEVIVLLAYSSEKTWLETGLLIVCNLIIAGGVLGEDRFAHAAGDAAIRLQQISDENVAQAQERAAQSFALAAEAKERAARLELEAGQAHAKAAEAELKLRRLAAPRTPNREVFLRELSGKPMPSKIDVVYSMDGADCSALAAWIAAFLRESGWPVEPPYPQSLLPSTVPNLSPAQMAGGQPWGITILDKNLQKSGGPAKALAQALFLSLGDELIAAVRNDNVSDGVLRVVVAPRP